MFHLKLLLLFLFLFTFNFVVESVIVHRLQCEPGVDHDYTFSSILSLWGDSTPAAQLFVISAGLEVKCLGACPDSVCSPDSLRNGSSTSPNLFHAKMIDPRVEMSQPPSSSSSSSPPPLPPPDPRLLLPFRFAQQPDGGVANVFFVRGDDEEEILNLKRTMIGAFQTNLDDEELRARRHDVIGAHRGHFRHLPVANDVDPSSSSLVSSSPSSSSSVRVHKTFTETDFDDPLDRVRFKSSDDAEQPLPRRQRRGAADEDSPSLRSGPIRLRGVDSKTFVDGTLKAAEGKVEFFFDGGGAGAGRWNRSKRSQDENEGDVLEKHLKATMSYSLTRRSTRLRRDAADVAAAADAADAAADATDYEFFPASLSSSSSPSSSSSSSATSIRLNRLQTNLASKVESILKRELRRKVGARDSKEMEDLAEGVWLEGIVEKAEKILTEKVRNFASKISLTECNGENWNDDDDDDDDDEEEEEEENETDDNDDADEEDDNNDDDDFEDSSVKWTNCVSVFKLLVRSDSSSSSFVERLLVPFLSSSSSSSSSRLALDRRRDLLFLLSSIPSPSSSSFLLLQREVLVSTGAPSDNRLIVALARLAGKESVPTQLRSWTSKFLLSPLRRRGCRVDADFALRLEALATLRTPESLVGLEQLFDVCDPALGHSVEVRAGVLGALVPQLTHRISQRLLETALLSSDCAQMEAALGALLQSTATSSPPTPLMPVDELLVDLALADAAVGVNASFVNDADKTGVAGISCVREQLTTYLRERAASFGGAWEDLAATETMQAALAAMDDAEGGKGRRRRSTDEVDAAASWTDSTCMTWDDAGGNFDAVQSPVEFRRDVAAYPHRRHCLGRRRVGVEKIHADFYAALFAGRSGDGGGSVENFKLLQKFVARAAFYDVSVNAASVEWTQTRDGAGSRRRLRVAVGGVDVLDDDDDDDGRCGTESPVDYGRTFSVSLQDLPLYVATISFAVTITPRVGVHFRCLQSADGRTTLALQPKTTIRLGGGATASLAVALQGGFDLGVDLNYFVDSEADVTPCVSANHGFDPMSITVSAWYQHDKGPREQWHPAWAEWQILQGFKQPWLGPKCSATISPSSKPPEFAAFVCTRWYKEVEIELNCQPPLTPIVRSAFYGWSHSENEDQCYFHDDDTYCARNATLPACARGQSSCTVPVARSQWAVGCNGLHDYLQVQYDCLGDQRGRR